MNDHDMRVIKTVSAIENALFELLRTKPLGRITVTELARTAQINKGTFYLHYMDISDLYAKTMLKTVGGKIDNGTFFEDFFDAPERFLEELGEALIGDLPHVQALLQGQSENVLLDQLQEKIAIKIYETGRIEKNVGNDMRLDAVFGALLSCMPKYYGAHKDEVKEMVVSMIRFFFPK